MIIELSKLLESKEKGITAELRITKDHKKGIFTMLFPGFMFSCKESNDLTNPETAFIGELSNFKSYVITYQMPRDIEEVSKDIMQLHNLIIK
jgi:hypothetical protein